jgi:LuxR family maltose regulon positive regulatory protein
MLADATAAVGRLPAGAFEAPTALLALGVAQVTTGDVERGDHTLGRAAEIAIATDGASWEACVALVFRAGLAESRGDQDAADNLSRRAYGALVEANLVDHPVAALVHAQSARFALRHGATARAHADLAIARRTGVLLTHAVPWLTLRARMDTAIALLALSDGAGARVALQEAHEVLWWRPGLGALEEELARLEEQAEAMNETRLSAFMLTVAELRLLPLLATHLSLPEISERLFLSTNTIKTQAKSIYRKLDVVSRTEAVERAAAIGLLDTWIRVRPAATSD